MFMRKKKGQSILEYAVFLGVIIAVIIVMQIYVKRAIQGKFKSNADQLGDQFSTGVINSVQTITQTARTEGFQASQSSIDSGIVQKSEIQTETGHTAAWAGADLSDYTKKAGDYKGAEISTTDNIKPRTTAAVGGVDVEPLVAEHGVMDSGVLKTRNLFDDDQ